MSDIQIKLPDGSSRALAQGANARELARSISPQLAKKVVVALVNGKIQDLA
ncbi:MAG: TGS domain-containing protein, partial [Myxococcales bacterium]|nr:TGS domain-containing protein [Myxococcales bacterium]